MGDLLPFVYRCSAVSQKMGHIVFLVLCQNGLMSKGTAKKQNTPNSSLKIYFYNNVELILRGESQIQCKSVICAGCFLTCALTFSSPLVFKPHTTSTAYSHKQLMWVITKQIKRGDGDEEPSSSWVLHFYYTWGNAEKGYFRVARTYLVSLSEVI